MRSLFLIGIYLFLTFASLAQRNIDVLHYKFEIELKDTSNIIHGKSTVFFKALDNISSITLDFNQSNRGAGMAVFGLDVYKGARDDNRRSIRLDTNEKLIINLGDTLRKGEQDQVTISYWGIPHDGLIISKNMHGDRTFFADNWPDRAHNWIPCVDDPADKATFEFIVTAPSQYHVISNGKLVEEKFLSNNEKLTHWKEDVPLPTKVMVIGVAKFAVKEYKDSPKNIPVSAWIYPQDSTKGFLNYSYAPEILKFYSNCVGPYPYEKLANVQSKTIFGGMENASAIFYSEGSASSKTSVEDLLAHEIAHQWFGDMVTEKKYSHLWLSEGFATYMTDIYLESKYGMDNLISRLKKERNDVINFKNGQPVVDSVSAGMNLLNPNSYQKGAWVLHMLRRQVGDSAFHLIIRKYYDLFKGKNADTEDFQNVVEEVTKKDFKQFFKQWLYTPGIPKLEVKWSYNNGAAAVTVTQTQKEIFQFPLEIALQTKSTNEKIISLNITKQTETFTIKSTEPIIKLGPDPSVNLLFEQK
jgi:aminopeptidase N